MKMMFLLILFQLKILVVFCQLDSLSKNILEELVRKEHPTGTICYTDRLGKWPVSNIRKSFNRRMFKREISSWRDSIYLTVKEKKYLDSVVNKLHSIYWGDDLFYNSKRIPEDSMWAYISAKTKEWGAQYLADTSENGRKAFKGRGFYTNTFQFSPVIFLRNKSVFLVYILRLCGSDCGVEELAFYKLENGKYKRWIVIGGGAF